MQPRLEIKLESGNTYRYDNATGLIFHNSVSDCDKYYLYCDSTNFSFLETLKGDDIEEHLIKTGSGFNQILLEMTTCCNMRCKYCIYSDHYFYSKNYGNDNMSFETAKKALDFYFRNFEKARFYNPYKKAAVGFYGGEPLLNFSCIEEIVNYCNREHADKYEIQYNITTNGLLLNEKIVDFLVNNNFAITVSIDGDQIDHDRNRVDVFGQATHARVMSGIDLIRQRHKDYPLLGVSACFDWKSDLKKMSEFFDTNRLFICKMALVDANHTDYYEQFTEDDIKKFNQQIHELKEEFKEQALKGTVRKDTFLYAFIGIAYAELFIHPVMAEKKPSFAPVTSTCVPGEKIYVDVSGKFHVCEKINPHHSIGDVNRGIDYDAVKNIIVKYFSAAKKCGCMNCSTQRYCNICYAQAATDNGFSFTRGSCKFQREKTLGLLKDSLELLEADPTLLEEVTVDYYGKIFEKAGDIDGEVF